MLLKHRFTFIFLFLGILLLLPQQLLAQWQCDPNVARGEMGSCQYNYGFPECYECVEIGAETDCVQDDTFCQDISGGNESNACRIGFCLEVIDPPPPLGNPTGCDYDLIINADDPTSTPFCALCDPPDPNIDSCGNGTCEPGEGEDCESCEVDCLLPGFDGVCPETNPSICQAVPITFTGPPYNTSLPCEDGDLCTNNACNFSTGECEVTGVPDCSNRPDFCCPPGCTAPADPLSCTDQELAEGCDIDCREEVYCGYCGNNIIDPGEECDGTAPNDCSAGCDDATCQCLVCSPIYFEGSGLLPCSLQKNMVIDPVTGSLALLSLGMALGTLFFFRKRLS